MWVRYLAIYLHALEHTSHFISAPVSYASRVQIRKLGK